jgi:hypothetical protein
MRQIVESETACGELPFIEHSTGKAVPPTTRDRHGVGQPHGGSVDEHATRVEAHEAVEQVVTEIQDSVAPSQPARGHHEITDRPPSGASSTRTRPRRTGKGAPVDASDAADPIGAPDDIDINVDAFQDAMKGLWSDHDDQRAL